MSRRQIAEGTMRFTREQLLQALEDRRPWAERFDARNLSKHRQAEKDYLRSFRKACREALNWDYATAKRHYFRPDMKGMYQPNCPSSLVTMLDRNLNVIKASRQVTFTVSPNGAWSGVHHLLTYDESLKEEMC